MKINLPTKEVLMSLHKKHLDIEKYRRINPQISEHDIKEIYKMFNAYCPIEGNIRAADVLQNYQNVPGAEELKMLIK